MANRVLTPEEAAALLKVTQRTLLQWLRDGKLPARKIGRRWYISEEALMAFIAGDKESSPNG
jgi:excisionase family DNA binding protein